ncbi:MAG: ATP-dependent RecD-like DNA helicase, partial [Eubacteriales bacterium]
GRQFEAELLQRIMPKTEGDIVGYLASGCIKGIGKKTALRLVQQFGEKTLDVLESQPDKLASIPGISPKKAQEISNSFKRQVGVRRLLEFLAVHHLSADLAMKLYRLFGDMAVDAIVDDPYLLTEEEFHADFAQVDKLAIELGIEGDDERRVEAGILFELRHNLTNGHTFLPQKKLLMATANLLSLEDETVREGVSRLDHQERLVLSQLKATDICYLPVYYEAETYVSKKLVAMCQETVEYPENLSELLEKIEKHKCITFGEEQKDAIVSAARHQVFILTGGPGTGKTTTLDGILDLFESIGLECLLAAPTGRAAKRLSQLTGRDATTIHRMLEAQFSADEGGMVFARNEEEPLEMDAVILDEVSMVDLQLMQAVLRALPPDCRLILVGDPDQLPSVGAGNLFSDIIRSKQIVTSHLTEIYRQARESLIVMNAHAINQGFMPDLRQTTKDFFFMRRQNPEALVQTICDLCSHRLPEKMGIPSGNIQVLSPTRKTDTGTFVLNQRLQQVLNPQSPEKREKTYGKVVFRQGDRVMQVKNNYDIPWKSTARVESGYGVFNGDMGIIEEIDPETETIQVIFDDERRAVYGFDMLSELEMAYAMTVHKSQGSEYPAVILVAAPGSPYLLTRSILYTAITRARDLLIILGDDQVIARMVENNLQQRRYSGLKLRLEKDGADCG